MIQAQMQLQRVTSNERTAASLVTKEGKYLEYILTHAERNNPESVIKETHKFAIERHWLMNVGPEKSPIVEEVLQEKRPKVILEIGCYLGYSAIRFASYIKNTLGIQDVKYYSLEISETHANIATQVVEFAGLSDVISIIIGPSDESIKEFSSAFNLLGKLDFVLIDHSKTVYKRDLQLLEQSGAFHTGTTIIADNVIRPGAPDYLDYVRCDTTKYQTRLVESWFEYHEGVQRDGVEISVWLK